ncbi:polysaccharide biosynthesis/export family protein [Penaeicola halotolerans]|uniref:polysaccharide biosynthesis/export family protein n=1 Tax=Penaeicola halotolerans TaxID=2793196 RepID=UPI001CF8AE54|nr:polysaccharide biosynthesis/export family protein [Penaeicola halotolerans]
MNRILSGLLFSLLLFTSCVSNDRLIYLQNLPGKEPIPLDSLITYQPAEYRLQVNDIIDVKINTAKEEYQNLFNINDAGAAARAGQGGGGDIYYLTGYTVDKRGDIELPEIGKVNVVGLTLEETKLKIEELVGEFVTKNTFVSVRLGGIRFSAFGEFNSPGQYVALQNRVTIFEAVARAGELSIVAKRNKLIVIRQYPEGSRIHEVNLLDRNIVNTPFYFVQPGDQLYAEPMKVREIGSGITGLQTLQLTVTTISAVLLILNLVRN